MDKIPSTFSKTGHETKRPLPGFVHPKEVRRASLPYSFAAIACFLPGNDLFRFSLILLLPVPDSVLIDIISVRSLFIPKHGT